MLTERNNKWMKILLAQNNRETQCIAVGALHMAGPNGLLTQFERKGYKVTHLN
jgi:uncharacterized protein YbaP (TraB family)